METEKNPFVKIEKYSGLDLKTVDNFYSDSLPSVIVSKVPIELQDFSLSPDGKGLRTSYSYRPTTFLEFSSEQAPKSIKSKLHKHDYYEIVLVASGPLEMQIESQLCEFDQWDICLLNRSTRHAEHFKLRESLFYLGLSSSYVANWPWEEGMTLQRSLIFSKLLNRDQEDTLRQNKDYILARYVGRPEVSPVDEIIKDIRHQFEEKEPGYQFMIRGLLYQFFMILSDPNIYQTEYVDLGSDQGYSLASSAKKILDRNKRKMTNREVADILNYNSQYIDRVFKKYYGLSLTKYNRAVYLRQAAHLLTTTDLYIHKISERVGFANRTQFYNSFKDEFGCTPAEYRKKGIHKNSF
jgi:AraC-like DNA-binding protein